MRNSRKASDCVGAGTGILVFSSSFSTVSSWSDSSSLSSSSSIVASLHSFGNSASIHTAEAYGLILSAIHASSTTSPDSTYLPHAPPVLFSDHQNSINIINNAISNPPLPHLWASLPARSLYRWLRAILCNFPFTPSLLHVKAHTQSTSPE